MNTQLLRLIIIDFVRLITLWGEVGDEVEMTTGDALAPDARSKSENAYCNTISLA